MYEIDNELLTGLYVEQEMSLRQIEKQLGLAKGVAKKLLINCAVPIRTRIEQCNTARHKARQQEIANKASANPEERKRRSRQLKNKWADDEWREDVLKKCQETWDNDPVLKQGFSDRMKNRWQDASYMADQIIAGEKSWQDPDIRAKKIAGIIQANKRPEVIEKKRVAALKALRNPLYHLEVRNVSRKYWSDPKNHERHSLTMQEVAKRPDYQEAVSMGLREYWAKPGKREQRALVSAAIWTRPGMREQIRRSLIKNWDERLRLKSILWGFDRKLPAFSKEEEAEFIKMVKQGNYKARYEFFCRNMGLAEKLAWRIWLNIGQIFPDHEEMDVDLEVVKQESYVALGRAIEKYDPKRFGTKFSVLAYISVPQKIIRALHDYGRLVRVPISSVGIYDGDALRSAFYVDGIKPEDEEEGINGFSLFRLEETVYDEDLSVALNLSKEQVIQIIKEKIPKLLSEKKERVLNLRLDGLTYPEIGLIERITKQRVQQIIAEIAARARVVIKELV